jgi:hypothetical protein
MTFGTFGRAPSAVGQKQATGEEEKYKRMRGFVFGRVRVLAQKRPLHTGSAKLMATGQFMTTGPKFAHMR